MIEQQTWTKLVKLAQQGHKDSLNTLARGAKGRLCAYIYRVTLNQDLTQDLSQEVLLQMVKSLDRLDNAERFWPWLYRIAQSKIQQHYKARQRTKLTRESASYQDFLSQRGDYHQDDAMRVLAQKELSKKAIVAMKQIKQQYRAVLSLRCFEQLSYPDIAVAMQCSEVAARVLFFRAKKALKKQLTHQGLSKGLLLMCLGVFGKLTAPAGASSSAGTVTAASTEVGLTAAIIATASSKLGIATIAAAVGLASIVGMSVSSEPPLPAYSLPQRAEVAGLHFTTQLQDSDPNTGGSLSKGAYEQWFYFPDGVDGPMFMRMQRWTPEQDEKLCSWLENGQGIYYYNGSENQVYIHNYRVCWSSLKVRRLPTDSVEFTDLLSQVEGDLPAFSEHTRDQETGLLTSSVDYRFVNASNFLTEYRYNTVGPEQFQYDWPGSVPVVDERDQMHKRGWTYFHVNGKLDGQVISGRGQIPFVYDTFKEHSAWMRLNIGDELEIIDCSAGARLHRSYGTLIAAYPAGTFFKGLSRPWMGMHTADIVRRDAVEKRIWFYSERLENEEDVIISLAYEDQNSSADLIYTINIERDIVNNIRFAINGTNKGSITFSYLQDISQVGSEFAKPVISDTPQVSIQQSLGMLWLIYLAEGNLGK